MSITIDGPRSAVVFPGLVSGTINLSATPSSGVHNVYLPDADGTLLLYTIYNTVLLPSAGGGTITLGAPVTANNVTFLFPPADGANGDVLTCDGAGGTLWTDPTTVVVTSFSGGTTGLLPNSPNTGNIVLSGVLDIDNGGTGITSFGTGVQAALQVNTNSPNGLMVANASGVLAIAQGGTGANNAVDAANNLLPSQAGNANKVLKTDGAGNLSWVENDAFMTVGFSQIYSGTTGSILIQTGTTLQEIVMGTGVANALAQNANSPNGLMVANASGVLGIAQGGTGLSALGAGVQTALSQNMGTANGFAALNGSGVLPVSQGGTGANTAAAAANNLLPAQSGPAGKVLASDGAGNLSWVNNDSGLTVNTTQIISGTTGSILTQTGTTLTEIVMGTGVAAALAINTNSANGLMVANGSGVLDIAQGGTGASTAAAAANNLLPAQSGPAGKVLASDGAGNLSWVNNDAGLTVGFSPIASGNVGSILTQAAGNVLGEIVMGTGVAAALAQNTNSANGLLVANASGVLPIAQGGTGLSALGTGVQSALSNNLNASGGLVGYNGTLGTSTSLNGSGSGTLTLQAQAAASGTLTLPNGNGTLLASSAALTSGSVLFAGAAGVITENNSAFSWNDAAKTLKIGTASSASGNITLFNSASAFGVTIASSANASAWTLSLPTTPGTAGQLLTTDGSGNCAWSSAGAADGNMISGNYGGAAPSNANGINGDYAFDSSTGNVYGPKTAGAWPATPAYVPPAVPVAPSGGSGTTPVEFSVGSLGAYQFTASFLRGSAGTLYFECSRDNGATWSLLLNMFPNATYGTDVQYGIFFTTPLVALSGNSYSAAVGAGYNGAGVLGAYVSGDKWRLRDPSGVSVNWDSLSFSQIG